MTSGALDLIIALVLAILQPTPDGPSPAQHCRWAMGLSGEAAVPPLTVDGVTLQGAAALAALRRAHQGPIVVNGGSFAGADLRGAGLHDICFYDADLSGSDWRGADAPGLVFVFGKLTGARLAGARLARAVFRAVDLDGVDAGGAMLSGGRIAGNWQLGLDDLKLDRADLRGFRFECGITEEDSCPLRTALSMRGADLTGASLASFSYSPDLTGARLDRTEISMRQLADLRTARIAGPLILVGGEARAEISPADYRALLPYLRPREEGRDPNSAFDRRPIGPPAWARPGAAALFVTPEIGFDPALRRHPLFARLLPVIIGSATGKVLVRVNADGTIDADGEAVGGNAHMCGLVGDNLRLDPATGWYSAPYERQDREPESWAARPMPVLRLWAGRAAAYRGGRFGGPEDPRPSEYVMCGARAGFEELLMVPAAPQMLARLAAEYASHR
jgi:uncharacterized protein YjbI with pentapeptide repeats